MKLAAILLLALPAWSQTAPPGPATVPVPLDAVKAIQAAVAAAQALPATPTALPAAAVPTEASQVFGIGVGVQGLGPAQFMGGDFIAQHVATNTYTIEATDFLRMPGGNVGTSVTAGLLNVLHRVGPVYIGVAGMAGAAEGATGSASGAISGWGVLGSTFGKSPLGIVFAAQTTKVAGAPGPTGQFKFYLTYSWFK